MILIVQCNLVCNTNVHESKYFSGNYVYVFNGTNFVEMQVVPIDFFLKILLKYKYGEHIFSFKHCLLHSSTISLLCYIDIHGYHSNNYTSCIDAMDE